MDKPETQHEVAWATDRMAALCDGIFAIAMTLLVLDLRIQPIPEGQVATELPRQLRELGPNIISYAVSFLILGGYWVNHHHQFTFIRRANGTLLKLNILFLLLISAIPFSTSLIGEYEQTRLAALIYGGNLAAAGLVLYGQWVYATDGHRLVAPDLDPRIIHGLKRLALIKPTAYLVGLAVSFLSVPLAIAVYVLFPVCFGIWVRNFRL